MPYKRPFQALLIPALFLLLTACRPAPQEQQEGRFPATSEKLWDLADQPRERVHAGTMPQTEWRDAVILQRGRSVRFDLGPATQQSAIRLGLLDKPGFPVTVRVHAGDRELRSLQSTGMGDWTDWRLDGLVSANTTVQVDFESGGTYWVSTAEVVTAPSAHPPVIVVLLDTLRRDHLGAYGYNRPTSPNIDIFAKESIRFDHLVPASSWTRPSVASLMTSTMPTVHGAEDMGDHLRANLPWIGDVFQKAGYETRALMTNPNCLPIWGFGGGFMRYVDVGSEEWLKQDDHVVMQQAAAAVRDAAGRPFLLYVHALAPHEPFTPAEPYRSQFASPAPADGSAPHPQQQTIDLYDAEIRYFDTLFGEFVAVLKDAGVYDSSIIIFVSDHGEAFGEHGDTGHGSSLYEEQMNPPLIIRLPGGAHAGEVRGSLIEMIDIAPTLAALAGAGEDPRFQGRSFVPVIESGAWDKTLAYASLQHRELSQYMARTQDTKYIHDLIAPAEEWFDLATDPLEAHPLATPPPADEPALRAHVEQMTSVGQAGLHILITHDSTKPLVVTGDIEVAGLEGARLEYPADRSSLQSDANTARFTATMPETKPGANPSARMTEAMDKSLSLRNLVALNGEQVPTEQDYVRFVAHVTPDAAVKIRIALDGTPVPAEQVHFGSARAAQALDGQPIPMAEVRGSSVEFNPAALPVRTAVYVWYLPSPDQVYGDQLTPEIRESLKALGYTAN